MLVGRLVYKNSRLLQIIITDLQYPDVEATEGMVMYDSAEVVQMACLAANQGQQVLGTIHSHPDYEPHISKEDIISAKYEILFGILSYWTPDGSRRRRVSVDWYYQGKLITSC